MKSSNNQINIIDDTIKDSLRKKFQSYSPETNFIPFHYCLLDRDRMALYSFIHSLTTTFGTSIFEPVAATLADLNFKIAKTQFIVGDRVSQKAQSVIQKIRNDLTVGKNPNKDNEIEMIRQVCQKGRKNNIKTVKVDLYLQSYDGTINLYNFKTAKPNISNFKDFKLTLLKWIAIYLAQNSNDSINSYIAIPYNP